jgi:hypothetical protein
MRKDARSEGAGFDRARGGDVPREVQGLPGEEVGIATKVFVDLTSPEVSTEVLDLELLSEYFFELAEQHYNPRVIAQSPGLGRGRRRQ